MTVKTLIEKLQKFDPDNNVEIFIDGDTYTYTIFDIDQSSVNKNVTEIWVGWRNK